MQLAGVPVPTTWSGEDVSTAPAPAGIAAVPSGLPGTGGAGAIRVIATAFLMKAVVSVVVMGRVGQNLCVAHGIARPTFTR